MSTQPSLLPPARFWVVTLLWPHGYRITCAPRGGFTQRQAETFAGQHEYPQGAFVIPVIDPGEA